jgi:glycosyltransferase involved in cell wall biosynthesis
LAGDEENVADAGGRLKLFAERASFLHFNFCRSSMKVTVIIPSFKRPADLQRCLEAVALQSRPADEVLVIGRKGDEETSNIVSAFRRRILALRLVPVTEPGLIAAMNCGLDNAAGDLLVFTDDDAEPAWDWLERIESRFADPPVGAVGGRDWIQLPDEPTLFRPAPVSRVGILTWYGKQFGNHHCPQLGHTRKVMFLKGVNMAFRRDTLGSYRVDTRLRGSGAQVGSEMDLCSQIRQRGLTVVFDDRILVKHYSSARTAGDGRNQLAGSVCPDMCFNNHYLIAKHFSLGRALAYFCNERLLGSRRMPGLLACLKWYLKGDRRMWSRLVQMTRVGIAGFSLGRHVRDDDRHARTHVKLGSPVVELEGQKPYAVPVEITNTQ